MLSKIKCFVLKIHDGWFKRFKNNDLVLENEECESSPKTFEDIEFLGTDFEEQDL